MQVRELALPFERHFVQLGVLPEREKLVKAKPTTAAARAPRSPS